MLSSSRPWPHLGVASVLAFGLASSSAPDAHAQPAPAAPKTPPVVKACNVSAIPLVVGNEWVYEAVSPPADAPPPAIDTKQSPLRPEKITIKVTSIETKDGVTTVALNETAAYRTQVEPPVVTTTSHDTTITCSGGGAKFQVDMSSFWFAGEVGKPLGIELTDVERKAQTLALAGGKLNTTGLSDWRDDITVSWKHVAVGKATPAMRKGTMSLLRHYVVLPDQQVASTLGNWMAKKLGIETQVKLSMDPPTEKPLRNDARCKDLAPKEARDPADPCQPVLLVNFMWLVDGVGPVQVLNSYGHMFQLNAATLQK